VKTQEALIKDFAKRPEPPEPEPTSKTAKK
jgi:hypothetical protein